MGTDAIASHHPASDATPTSSGYRPSGFVGMREPHSILFPPALQAFPSARVRAPPNGLALVLGGGWRVSLSLTEYLLRSYGQEYQDLQEGCSVIQEIYGGKRELTAAFSFVGLTLEERVGVRCIGIRIGVEFRVGRMRKGYRLLCMRTALTVL
ncbi:hypothetical protein Trydic_g14936 [Trypoxylus dichotomus]